MASDPDTRYARTADGLHIAFQVSGEGRLDIVEMGDGTVFPVDATSEQIRWQAYVDRLTSFSRLIRFDRRGTGLSDPLGASCPFTLEQWAADTLAATADHVPWVCAADIAGEVEEFLTGTRHLPASHRRLAAVLFTDIVGSTEQAALLGDRAWKERLDQHDEMAERQIRRFAGRFVKSTGDGTLATFDGPARAIQCALAIRDALGQLGLGVRAGVHIGEIELRGDDVAGIAVHIAQRVSSLARPGDVLVSRTVVDLVAGSDLAFEDRGEHELKGLPGGWQLFAVTD